VRTLAGVLVAVAAISGCGSAGSDEEDAWRSYESYVDALFHGRPDDARRFVAGSPTMDWHAFLEKEAVSPQFACDKVRVKRGSVREVGGQLVLELELSVSYSGNFGAGFFPPDKRYRQTATMTKIDGVWKAGKVESAKLP
jgi:hypothetical protein